MGSHDRLQAVVRRCQRGEQAAFEELFRRFQPRLRYYVRRLDAGHDHADDVLQDIWVKVVRRIGSLRDGQAFVAWLYTIARHEVYGRAKVKDPFLELTDEGLERATDNHEPGFDGEDAVRLHVALEKLEPHHREILTLYFLEELSHQEIAGILGLRAGTVKSRIYYAKQSLRQELERNHGPS
jgi:RNA polymerase sigma-70 factor (ECF subfamily)